jgi:Copper/zinc superoxide dismutase (SODC)
VARLRKTAIAAVALSALVLTSGAAYADHGHSNASSSGEGMSWAYYGGAVTDFTTTTPDMFKRARASAAMIGMDGRSFFRLRVTGIDAKDGKYGVHLHQGTCVAGDPVAAGPHYNVTWNSTTKVSDLVSSKTEVWLDLNVDSDGDARSTATVSFIPEGTRSIVLHALPTAADGTAGARLACLPFSIKATG